MGGRLEWMMVGGVGVVEWGVETMGVGMVGVGVKKGGMRGMVEGKQ